jgi:DNA invertase Pin-like site-specific DNA recombinase
VSISEQLRILEELAKEKGIDLPYEQIIEIESGMDFPRKGISKILDIAENKPLDYVLVLRLDRLGRDMTETPYFMKQLFERGVKILAPEKMYSFSDPLEIIQAVFECYAAQVEDEKIGKRSQGGRIERFRQGFWPIPAPPLYERDKEGRLKKKDLNMGLIVQDAHRIYQKEKNATKVLKWINQCHHSILGKAFTYNDVKTILYNPVYKGKPAYGGISVDRPELAMVEEKLFDATQKILKDKATKHKKKENVLGKLVKEHGLSYVTRTLSLPVPCLECGSIMVENGTKTARIRGIEVRTHLYLCTNCGKQRTVPSIPKLAEFIGLDLLCCPRCHETENFDFQKLVNGNWRYTCRCCGFSFETCLYPNKYLRRYPKTWQKPCREILETKCEYKENTKKSDQAVLDKYWGLK